MLVEHQNRVALAVRRDENHRPWII